MMFRLSHSRHSPRTNMPVAFTPDLIDICSLLVVAEEYCGRQNVANDWAKILESLLSSL